MLKVGVTGGIGSGKTTVCKIFSIFGIPVFEADKEAKRLMDNDIHLRQQLSELFGESVCPTDRPLDRRLIAQIVFNDQTMLAKLNAIVHPAVAKAFAHWYSEQQSPYVILEAAILFESGFNKMMDKTIAVKADLNERIQRIAKRDGATREMIEERMRNQWDDQQRISMVDFVIGNNDNELAIPQIIEIDKQLRKWQK